MPTYYFQLMDRKSKIIRVVETDVTNDFRACQKAAEVLRKSNRENPEIYRVRVVKHVGYLDIEMI